MTAIANPFTLLSDASGRLIDGGYVHIGLPNIDPEANPAPVFWDEALTIAAEQPLRTIAGYIARDGTPAKVFIEGAYSIRVRQADGTAVFTDLNAVERNPGGLVETLIELKNAPINDVSVIYKGALWTWTAGDFSGQADDESVVRANGTPLTAGAWVRQDADAVSYRAPGADSVTQSAADTVRRQRLNLYDKIPRALWAGVEAGTNATDLTPYVLAALGTGRGVNARQGRFRMKLAVTEGNGLSIRGEGKHLTYFENVDDTPVVTLDSSAAHIFEFELEDIWLENRDPGQFAACDLLKITGAGNGEAWQNDKHHFRNLWFFRGRDNIVCDNRSIWTTWDRIESTGALRDAVHVEVSANVNQWSWRDVILKGAGRNGLFFKHDVRSGFFDSLATGWTFQNVSTEDCGYEGWRFFGSGGCQGFGAAQCTFENNARLLAPGHTAFIEGVRRRKTSVFGDAKYIIGLDINGSTFYNNSGGGTGGNPDQHIYLEGLDAIEQSGAIANSRFLVTQTGVDVIWPVGLTYHNNNTNAGTVQIDEARQSIDMRKFTPTDNYAAVLTLTGVTGEPMGTARFVRQGDLVTAYIPLITGTSNAADATLTGLPQALWPDRDQTVAAIVQDDAGIAMGLATIRTSGLIVLGRDVGGGAFTASGTKGVRLQTLTWMLS